NPRNGNRRRLPPLNALRAFESAARHGNFSSAADELCVTPAAVSQQVKLLESFLNVKLFLRNGAHIGLTEDAIQYLPVLSQAFDSIDTVTQKIVRSSSASNLSISSFTQFAMAWLLPRMHSFNRAEPWAQVTVITAERSLDFVRSGMDVAIRWGKSWPNLTAHYLFSLDLVPLCAPSLLKGGKPLRKPQDILAHRLLMADGAEGDWVTWLEAMDVDPRLLPLATTSFDSLAFGLQAACDGQGIVMARLPLADSYLREGTLVYAFDKKVRSDDSYFLLYPKSADKQKKVQVFRDWILAEAAKSAYYLPRNAEP
ncbi:MAG TPA: transcriptional regulator GcvA, partial [Ramlibacter sp.]|nr:transcriptional regulator GcvA [Ramlibacter sp.]